LGVLAVTALVQATTFVAPTDDELLSAADAVVLGQVLGIESAARADAPIRTYVAIDPEEILVGELPLAPFVIREPGGVVGERAEWVFGAPEFRVGERVLLFLKKGPDGVLHTLHLALGKFSVQREPDGREVALQNAGYGATVYTRAGRRIVRRVQGAPRDLEELRARIGAAPRGRSTGVPPVQFPLEMWEDKPREYRAAFTFLGSPARWFEPDAGQAVAFRVQAGGDAGLGGAATTAAVNDALAAWTHVPNSSLVLANGGEVPSVRFSGCGACADNSQACWADADCPGSTCIRNRVLFNDPFGEVDDPSGCGGTLALGGFCASTETKVVNGTTFRRIVSGVVMVNNGFWGCPFWNPCNVAEVLTHELGHTVGFGHSTVDSATMRATAHFDGRCAGLASDDEVAAAFSYPAAPQSATPTPTVTTPPSATPTRTWTPTPALSATATPSATVGVPGGTPTPTVGAKNLALGKAAVQSSTGYGGVAGRAVDGNRDGNYFAGSVTHTGLQFQPWWQVDLGAVGWIEGVGVWNRTDCCAVRLSDFYVLVSEEPFGSGSLSGALGQAGVSGYFVSGQGGRPTEVAVGRTGRYVRVQLVGTDYLSLAEVEVWGTEMGGMPPTATPTVPLSATPTQALSSTPTRTWTPTPALSATATPSATVGVPGGTPTPTVGAKNLALGKAAVQSSTGYGGVAGRAVDGNRDGNYFAGSVTHTGLQFQPWWQVDLGAVGWIEGVGVWNRTDCCAVRLSDFYVLVSEEPFGSGSLSGALGQAGVSGYFVSGQGGRPTEVAVGRTGRYVRVQLVGTDYLSLAEVEVWGMGT